MTVEEMNKELYLCGTAIEECVICLNNNDIPLTGEEVAEIEDRIFRIKQVLKQYPPI